MKKYVIFVILLSVAKVGFNQTGPGGVGTADGTSNLEFWLDANRGTSTTTDGANIVTWSDQSGNGINVTQGTTGNQPSYEDDVTNAINGYPIVFFDGDDELQSPSTSLNISNDFSVFSVKEDNTTQPSSNSGYLTIIGSSPGIRVYRDATQDKFLAKASGAIVSDYIPLGGVTNNAPFIGEYSRTGTTMFFSKFGSAYTTDVGTTGPIEFGTTPTLSIGSFNGSLYLQGNVAEQIIYSRKVNSAEKILIENYLAAKYDISLTNNDVYSQDNAGSGDYDHDVAGIGRVDASNISDNGKGTGRIWILNPTNLDDDEFLMWGHDGATQSNTTDIPVTMQSRFERIWRVSEVNSSNTSVDVGSVDVRFDLSELDPITASDLRLLVDTDNDGLFSDETGIAGATDLGSDLYEFAGVTTITDGLRFTIGTIDVAQTALPVQLTNFEAVVSENNHVKIDWQTASEINNDFFTVERSINGKNWEKLQKINGAGNSSTLINYNFVDRKPLNGTSYYRLKQTDFNQQFAYSKIEVIQLLEIINRNVLIYPNPVNDLLTVEGNHQELMLLNIYNVYGQNVTESIRFLKKNETNSILDLSNLGKGTYIIKTATSVNKIYKN